MVKTSWTNSTVGNLTKQIDYGITTPPGVMSWPDPINYLKCCSGSDDNKLGENPPVLPASPEMMSPREKPDIVCLQIKQRVKFREK